MQKENCTFDARVMSLTTLPVRIFHFSLSLAAIIFIAVNFCNAQAPGKLESKRFQIPRGKQLLNEELRPQAAHGLHSSQAGNIADGDLDPTFNPVLSRDIAIIESFLPLPDGKTLVGGSFINYNGAAQSGLVRLNADGSLDTSFNVNLNGGVWSIVQQTDGKLLIGGNFTQVNGTARTYLARLNSDGTLDASFNFVTQSTGSIVYDIKLRPDGKMVVGGSFFILGALEYYNVAQLNPDGSVDTSFNTGGGLDGAVYRVGLQADGKVLLAGFFYNVDGVEKQNFARLNQNGSLDTTFTANGGFSSGYEIVPLANGQILVGGDFTSINGTPRQGIARLNANGSLDNSFMASVFNQGVGPQGYVEKIEVQSDGKIVAAGLFTIANGTPRNHIARFNTDGSVDSSFNPGAGANASVEALALRQDGKIFAGGPFTTFNQTPLNRVSRLNDNGSIDTAFNIGSGFTFVTSGTVYSSIVQPDGKILIGGTFDTVNGVNRDNIARLNGDGSLDTSFNPGSGTLSLRGQSGTVTTLTRQADGKIFIGGFFTAYNGVPYKKIVRLNADGSIDPSFSPLNIDGIVYKIVLQPDNRVLVAGVFDFVNSILSSGVIRLTANGAIDQSFLLGVDAYSYDIALQPDGRIIVGKQSTFQSPRLIRLNPDGTADITFNPGGTTPNGAVRSVTLLQDGKILITGSFTNYGGTQRLRVARVNPNGTLDTSFNPSGASGSVYDALIRPDGKILIGGNFTNVNGITRSNLALLNADGTLDNSFTTPTNSTVWSLTPDTNNRVLVNGFFSSVGGTGRTGVARLLGASSNLRTPFDFDGDGKADVSVFRPANGGWYISQSSNNQPLSVSFGQGGDLLAPADFDGDGRADISVFRNGSWYRLNSSNGQFVSVQFGTAGDLPVPADFDGDGKADVSVFRPSNGTWYRLNSSNGQFVSVGFGEQNDVPLVGDFDGDAKADVAVFRPSNGGWYRLNSSNGQFVGVQFGAAGDKAVPADYEGDGKTDIAVFRESNGGWYRLNSSNGQFVATQFGTSGDVPAPADYDGDGKADLAVFRSGVWFVQRSTQGFFSQSWGAANDSPIPSAFVR